MAKFITRLGLKKVPYCVLINNFQLFCPASSSEFYYSDIVMELRRGKARKVLTPMSSGKPKDQEISADNTRVIFDSSFLQISQFYKSGKTDQGQKKLFSITIKAKRGKIGCPVSGNHVILCETQFDMSTYIGMSEHNLEIEFEKTKIPKSFI
mmetsp:Transcript_5082/g.7713  ORF Transcript_5082/g.7713 Transcript_5082/m.7713 type:complete len:152 (+) Transcript_5082:3-458(+)